MLTALVVLVLVIGLNTLFWGAVGVVRLLADRRPPRTGGVPLHAVAVVIAAHNEEAVIASTLKSAARLLPVNQIFVASDGSTDRTAELARGAGVNVLELNPNRGKAGALLAALEHFDIYSRFEVVTFLDADTRLASDYFETGLPLFTDDVVAVAGCARSQLDPAPRTLLGRILVAYRERVYIVMQYFLKFGQAARALDVIAIAPGFASMYRTRALKHIDIAAENLAIEDYNMTFEVHAKRLGRIAFHPRAAMAYTQDPDTLRDYAKQVLRWNLGFWQTIRRHGFRRGRFWVALAVFTFELVVSSAILLALIPAILITGVAAVVASTPGVGTADLLVTALPPLALLVGLVLPDYVLTVIAAVVARRPSFLLLGLAFPLTRMLDAFLCLGALEEAFTRTSSGRWTSPTRRPAELTRAT
ncbi:glycosyltransferase family 2 protein [Herbiconiux sp. SYSU D00978]|uniref:glycosyltransferase family 2 protein n=1 Tax=Herbiconiux sp. SYSU D00978 TaxID=2812562 RepID=UPI001A96D9D8|nr:glycosyltransferase family 2 protein [Herbiconiux sp. SYSU D00978]